MCVIQTRGQLQLPVRVCQTATKIEAPLGGVPPHQVAGTSGSDAFDTLKNHCGAAGRRERNCASSAYHGMK